MDETSRKTLELFIEKTQDLAEYVSENNPGHLIGIIRNVGEEEWHIHSGIQGLLLTFRMFIQSRDKIALFVLEQEPDGQPRRPELLDLPGMSDNWYEKVGQAHKWVTDALAIAPPDLIYNGKPITRWEILEVFLFGKYAHANAAKRGTFNRWQSVPDLFEKLLLEFVSTLWFIIGQVLAVAEASKYELSLNT